MKVQLRMTNAKDGREDITKKGNKKKREGREGRKDLQDRQVRT